MHNMMDTEPIRKALALLPDGAHHGELPDVRDVYVPLSHRKAMDPNSLVVTAMRGAGKTFWWSALQNGQVRDFLGGAFLGPELSSGTEVKTGFGVTPMPDAYPSKDVLRQLVISGFNMREVWRTVQAWHIAPADHPLRGRSSWADRTEYVRSEPESVDRLFFQRDGELDRENRYFLILFDALDRCSDDWKTMYQAIRGLLQTALEMRAYRRLRVKVFLRTDQLHEPDVADFPDGSKVLATRVELNWPRRDLYGLLWHSLANGRQGQQLRKHLGGDSWGSIQVGTEPVFQVKGDILNEERQREMFHAMAGPWMGRGPKRGFPYTWIPNHLSDTDGMVSPRSFLAALREAASDTMTERPNYRFALHYDSIKRGVQAASRIRVQELQEDYPWVDLVLRDLRGMVVPCEFREVETSWAQSHVLEHLAHGVLNDEVKLPPQHLEAGPEGLRQDLETLGVFQRMRDARVNIPDVFRVGYGIGRRGGVRPAPRT